MFLDGLSSLLSELKETEILATVNNGQQVLDLLQTKMPDMVIIDLNMPVLNGIETTRKIKEIYPRIVVLGLTMDTDLQSVTQLLQAGASG